MKRKGRKGTTKTSEESTNGAEEPKPEEKEQNGDQSGSEAAEDITKSAKGKKRSSSKSKTPSPKKRAKKADTVESEKEDEASDADEPQYEVQKVLDEKKIDGVRHFLIRWKGYEPESDTWEPESTLNCPKLIAEFKSKQKGAKKSPAKEGRGKKSTKKSKKNEKGEDVETWDENEDFEVHRILDVYFKKDGSREFHVSWKGYPPSQSSWEPEANMDCKDLIQKFMSKVEKARSTDSRELRVNPQHTDRLTLQTNDSGRRLSKRNCGQQRVHYHDAE